MLSPDDFVILTIDTEHGLLMRHQGFVHLPRRAEEFSLSPSHQVVVERIVHYPDGWIRVHGEDTISEEERGALDDLGWKLLPLDIDFTALDRGTLDVEGYGLFGEPTSTEIDSADGRRWRRAVGSPSFYPTSPSDVIDVVYDLHEHEHGQSYLVIFFGVFDGARFSGNRMYGFTSAPSIGSSVDLLPTGDVDLRADVVDTIHHDGARPVVVIHGHLEGIHLEMMEADGWEFEAHEEPDLTELAEG